MRHVKSDWEAGHYLDFDRTIRKGRREDAVAAAAYLSGRGFEPELILSSPAFRTMQTTLLMLPAWDYEIRKVKTEMDLYESGSEAYLRVISGVPDAIRRILVVGHNPSLTDLFNFLDAGRLDVLPTAGCAWFELESDSWDLSEMHSCTLQGFWKPSASRD